MTDEMMTLRGQVEGPRHRPAAGGCPAFAAERPVGPSGNFAKARYAVFGERFTSGPWPSMFSRRPTTGIP